MEKRFSVGRSRECDVPIADDSVSRNHAQIILTEGDHIFLTDCRSANGTFVIRSGRKIAVDQDFLSPDDSVQFGEVVLSVEDLLAAIRRKHPKTDTNHLKPKPPEPPPPPDPRLGGQRLVRCLCGDVKVKGERCRTCGA